MMTQKENNSFLIKARRILTSGGFRKDSALIVRDGVIRDIVDVRRLSGNTDLPQLDAADADIVPGYCDLHVHGGAGADFMDATHDAFSDICRFHAAGGTTALLATTACARKKQILDTLEMASGFGEPDGAAIAGVHLEGPYFNMAKKGCHLPSAVRDPDLKELDELLEYEESIARMTLAPELPGGLEVVRQLRKYGIMVSPGHSMASFSLIKSIAEDGPLHATHMYCAMSDVIKTGYQREGGIVQAVLYLENITTEIIADGRHLPPELIALTVKIKGYDNVCLCTDAMRGAGMPDGIYPFGPRDGSPARVRSGEAVTLDETGFASSVVQMNDLVKYMVNVMGMPVENALAMASIVPARIIGISDVIGSLEKNKRADFLVMTPDLSIKEVWLRGRRIVPGPVQ